MPQLIQHENVGKSGQDMAKKKQVEKNDSPRLDMMLNELAREEEEKGDM